MPKTRADLLETEIEVLRRKRHKLVSAAITLHPQHRIYDRLERLSSHIADKHSALHFLRNPGVTMRVLPPEKLL